MVVDNGSHDGLDLLQGCSIELLVDASNPVGIGVGVDGIDVDAEIEDLLFFQELHDVWVLAERVETLSCVLSQDAGLVEECVLSLVMILLR